MPPAPAAKGAVSTSTEISWKRVPGAASYAVWRRRTDQPYWEGKPLISGLKATNLMLKGVRGDDWFFGVSALAPDGTMSPIASAVPGGIFAPEPDDAQAGK